jgi:hypothetical protein
MQVSPRNTSLQETTHTVSGGYEVNAALVHRERSPVPALHCTCCHVAADRHEASRPEHDDAWGARLSTRTTNRAWARSGGGRTGSCLPGVNGDSLSNLHAQKQSVPCRAIQGQGAKEIWPAAARSQSQKAGGGAKVVPWRRASGRSGDADRPATRESGREPSARSTAGAQEYRW